MKTLSIMFKSKLLAFVVTVYTVVFFISSADAVKSLNNSIYYLIEMFQVLPVIFLFTVVIEVLVPKEIIIRGFGEGSGLRGNVLALLLGSISAGPIYAAFPISKTLLGKGASIANIVIILSSWAVIKVPMLANEVKFLGLNFMVIRWFLTVTAIFVMAFITGLIVKKNDLPVLMKTAAAIEINESYCISCGLCARLFPEFIEMGPQGAQVIKTPKEKEATHYLIESVRKCPTNAIILNMEEV